MKVTETIWTADEVKYQLKEAADTLKAMRLSGRDFPSVKQTYWPDVVRDAMDCYGYDAATLRRPIPDAEKIDRMDRALPWLLWLEKEQRRIVWARSSGIPWRYLEDMDGRSDRTLRGIYGLAIDVIVRRLNAATVDLSIEQVFGTRCPA